MRILWATILALCVLGALVRAASCHEIEPSLLDLLAEGPECPEPRDCLPPPEWTVASEVNPAHPAGTRIETTTSTGYDPDSGSLCAVVEAVAVDGERRSEPAVIRSAERCIEVPEPPGMLAVGALGMAWWARRRSR